MYNLYNDSTAKCVGIKYIDILNDKINNLKLKLDNATRNRKIYEQFILKCEKDVHSNSILDYVKSKNAGIYKSYNKFKLSELYKLYVDKFNTSKFLIHNIPIKGVIRDEQNKLIFSYYYNFMKYAISENDLDLEIEVYENLTFSPSFISLIFRLYFKHIGLLLLNKGNSYSLPFKILLKIVSKNASLSEVKYHKIRNVDWKASLDTLLSISKDIKPNIYKSYINKNINKKEFIQSMKSYTYNKIDNPTGKKWIVKRLKDYNLWLVLISRYSNLTEFKNYNIVPTNFIINKTKSQIDFTDNANDIDEIITSKLLGFRDKLRALERFDLTYCMNTFQQFNYGVQINK